MRGKRRQNAAGAVMDEERKNGAEVPQDGQNCGADNQKTPQYDQTNARSGQNGATPEEPGGGQSEGNFSEGSGGKGSHDGGHGGQKERAKFTLWQRPAEDPNRKKYSRAFQVALAGISCGIAVAALMLGYYVNVLIGTAYIVAQIALMIPLSKQFYGVDLLAYIATVVLALLVGGLVGRWWEFIPFVMFFGLHPIVNSLQIRYRVNRWLALVVKMIWFDAMLFVMYYALGSFMGFTSSEFWQTINNYVWIIILVAGSLLLWLYDFIMFKVQIWINMLVYRIKK